MWHYVFAVAVVLAAVPAKAEPALPNVAGTTTVGQLRTEYRQDPLGIDAVRPRLSWILASDRRGARQTAYQVLVASSAENLAKDLGNLWDSGRVVSDQSILVPYAGKTLSSGTACWWKVRVWDAEGRASAWSRHAFWSMGLLKPEDWKAQWIGHDQLDQAKATPKGQPADETRRLSARYLRRDFRADRPIARATAYVCGLGLFELHVNGAKIGDHVLEPALSDYDKRCYYVAFDVTQQLHEGHNAVGAILGNGRFWAMRSRVPTRMRDFGYPRLLLQIEIQYADGSRGRIVSDKNWRVTDRGPILANNEYDGEEYDARKELTGWDQPGYGAASWEPVWVVKALAGRLVAQMIEPIRVTGTVKPVSVANPRPGMYVFDMGQNMVGWCRLKVQGPAGAEVRLRHAETLLPDGTLYTANLRSAKATDVYTLKGGAAETYQPRFTYHGFRYVELTGYPGKPELSAIEGQVVHDDLPRAGEFTCSNDLLNKLAHNVFWGLRGNYRSIVTDCPQRDERQGWLGDRAAEATGEASLFNIAPLYAKWLTDVADSQQPDGNVSDVCPSYWPLYSVNVTWPSLGIIVPGMIYEEYGDLGVLKQQYPVMNRWMQRINATMKDGIAVVDNYGDWCVPPESPRLIHSQDPARQTAKPLLATSYHCHNLRLMARYATLLGKADDARQFARQADDVQAAFNHRFFKSGQDQYDNGSQTSFVLPLAFDLVPRDQRRQTFEHMVEKVVHGTHRHIGTGLVGGQWLMRVLSDNGRADLAYTLATQKDYPSWGYMVEHGATTFWELWNGDTADPAMNSGNHAMLIGDLYIWMNRYLAGIRPDAEQPGYKHFVLRPTPVGELTFAGAVRQSPYGTIASQWRRQGERFTWEIIVPANSTATVYVPTSDPKSVTEGGKPAEESVGVTLRPAQDGAAVLDVASGCYRFQSVLPFSQAAR